MLMEPEKLVSKLQNKQAGMINFASHKMIVEATGALIWPSQRLLVVSDCHFEKASFLGAFANPIPHYDSLKTLHALQNLVDYYSPEHVICLGDSFHDQNAWSRLSDSEKQALIRLVQSRQRWTWILGNHDPELPSELPGDHAERLVIKNLIFLHEPEQQNSDDHSQIFGHFHPKLTKTIARHRMTGKCFMYDESKMVMPAFGAFTGGLSIKEAPLSELFNLKKSNKHLIYSNKIHAV